MLYFYYNNEDNVTYLMMTELSYPRATALGCLDSIKNEFTKQFRSLDFSDVSNFGLNSQFKSKLQKKYDYYNKNKDVIDEKSELLKINYLV